MTENTKPSLPILTILVILGGTSLLAGCGSSERVSRTTTEQTTVSTPASDNSAQPTGPSSTTTTTTIRKSEP